MRVGAIDIGSNSVRLLVAEIPDSEPWGPNLDTLARAGEACRLGKGLHESGKVDDDLVDRAGIIVAESLRRATNGAAAAERISEVAGVPVRILSEADEARLVYRSVVMGLGKSVRGS